MCKEKIKMITITEAIYFLMSAGREEVHDEVLYADSIKWTRDGKVVAYGRFSTNEAGVKITIDDKTKVFSGSNAVRLRTLGVCTAHENGKLYSEAKSFVIPEETQEEEYFVPDDA